MSDKKQRPPEQRALFDRVAKIIGNAKTPTTVDEVAAMTDPDCALALVLVLVGDIEAMIDARKELLYCGHCRVHDAKAASIFETLEQVQAHILRCEHNPLVRAVWAALNAQDTLDLLAAQERSRGHRLPEEREIEPVAHATIDALRRMVGR